MTLPGCVRESQVRNRLRAGGSRIRTIGPSRGFPRSEPLARKQTVSLCWGGHRECSMPGTAVKLMRKLMRKQGFAPKRVVTDKLRS